MSSNAVKVAIGGAVALLLILVFLRSGNEPEPIGGPKPPEVDAKAADAVRQRLDQLRSSRDGTVDVPAQAPAAKMKVESKAPAPAAGGMPARPPQPAAPGGNMQRPPEQIPPAPHGGNVTGSGNVRDTVEDMATLKNMATSDKNPDRRLEAITLLGASEEPEVVPVLGQALSDEDPEVRLAAIQALADFTGDNAFDLLGKAATDDPEADNRYEALEALSDLEDERATIYARRALDDPDEEVRELAETMLGIEEGAAPPH